MRNITLRRNYLLYLITIAFFAVFYLYSKHSIGNDSSISEWLINYNGGFTRRGMGGEITIFFADLFNISLRKSILLVQIFLHLSYLSLIYYYLKELKVNFLQLLSLFAPLFLLFPVAEIEALGRKEIILFISFLLILIFSDKKFSPLIPNSITFFLLPFVCLIWEEIVLFFPFYASVLIIKNEMKSLGEVFKKISIIFLPSVVAFLYIYLNPISISEHEAMCRFLENKFNERCYMSASLLVTSTIYFDTLWVHKNATFIHYIRYIIIFIVGFLPIHILLIKNKFLSNKNFIFNNFRPIYIFFILYIPCILLFTFGYDWGRWMNILYTFSVLFYFYLLKNSLISNNLQIKNNIFKIINKKKIVTITIFVLFAFSWNPKTVITGDVASFPGYRIPYKFFKIIND